MTSYKKQAFISVSWVGLIRGLLRISSLVRTIILARILSPEQFGIFGIAAIVLGLTEMFTETGVNVVLIQNHQKNWTDYLNTAWVVSIIRGLTIAIVMIISSPLVVTFFQSPSSYPIIFFMALVPLIRGFINPSIVKFQKQLRFDKEFQFKAAIILADATVAIITALIFRNAVSLAAGLIAGAFTEVFLSLLFIHPKPALSFNLAHAKHIIHHGKWMTGAGIASYFAGKMPDIVIGKMLGTQSLGIYQMAYRFALLPIEEIIETVNRVAFPLYTSLNQSIDKIKIAIKHNVLILTVSSVIWAIIINLFPQPLIAQVLGNQWLEIHPILQSLSLVAVVFALSAPPEPVMLALRKQNLLMISTVIRLLAISLTIVPLLNRFGVVGTILAIAVALLIVLPYKWLVIYQHLYQKDQSSA